MKQLWSRSCPYTVYLCWLDRKFGLDGYVRAPDNTGQWFDGCDRDVILFDDVEVGQVPPFSLFKRLCDRYPITVAVKGGFITWKPKIIVFTSNYSINEWWQDLNAENIQARDRRIYIIEVKQSREHRLAHYPI